MKTKFQTIIVLSLFSCSLKSQIVHHDAQTDCQLAMATFENAFMSSCPISKGPKAVIEYLENYQGFKRNDKFDFGNGSVRFNAVDASVYGYPVVDDKSLFLLNYWTGIEGYEGWSLFQAIYFFKNQSDYEVILNNMEKVIDEELNASKKVMYILANEAYYRVYMPCGSGFI